MEYVFVSLKMIHMKVLSANLLITVEKRLSAFLNMKNLLKLSEQKKSGRVKIKQKLGKTLYGKEATSSDMVKKIIVV